jgi:argininosuccinate lyase
LQFALPQIRVKEDILDDEKYRYIYTVDAVNELVNKGVPFREAYRQVGNDVANGHFNYHAFDMGTHTHEGSMGHLCNDAIKAMFRRVLEKF